MNNGDRILAIRELLKSNGWTEYLKPELEKTLSELERQVLEAEDLSGKERKKKRHEACAIRKIIRKPERDLMHLSRQIKGDEGEG